MAAPAGRVICVRCGANNFDTQAACWKCGAALAAGAAPSMPPQQRHPGATAAGGGAPQQAPVNPAFAAPQRPAYTTVDPAIAVWSSVGLAFFFPFVAVPVGIVFLMLDDRRKAEIGRITLIWGLVFSLFQTIGSFLLIREPMQAVMGLAQGFGARAGRTGADGAAGGAGNGIQQLQQKVEPLPNFPQ